MYITNEISNSSKSETEQHQGIDENFKGKIQKMKYLVEMSIKKLNEIAEWIEISRLQKLDARFESKFHEQVES